MAVGICLLGLIPAAAQDNPPTLTVSSPYGAISLDAPEGWQVSSPSNLQYGIMSNLPAPPTGQPLSEVQMIIRPAEAFASVLNEPIDLGAENPALDYLQKYAARGAQLSEGAFADPAALTDGNLRAGVMLYVEKLDEPRFGEGVQEALSLGVVVYLGEGQLAVILMDGPAAQGDSLLRLWSEMLPTLRINDETPAFAAGLPALLLRFTPPDDLWAQSRTAPSSAASPSQSLTFAIGDNTVILTPPSGWMLAPGSFQAGGSAVLASPDSAATFSLNTVRKPESYTNPANAALEMLSDASDVERLGDAVAFQSGAIHGAALRLRRADSDGTLLLLELPNGHLLTLYFQKTLETQTAWELDWLTMLRLLTINGEPLDFHAVIEAMTEGG